MYYLISHSDYFVREFKNKKEAIKIMELLINEEGHDAFDFTLLEGKEIIVNFEMKAIN